MDRTINSFCHVMKLDEHALYETESYGLLFHGPNGCSDFIASGMYNTEIRLLGLILDDCDNDYDNLCIRWSETENSWGVYISRMYHMNQSIHFPDAKHWVDVVRMFLTMRGMVRGEFPHYYKRTHI